MIYFPAQDNAFAAVGIDQGDALVLEEATPNEGDFTIIAHNDKYQLVQLIGWDSLGNPIICRRYTTYPNAVTLFGKACIAGRVTNIIKAEAVYKHE